MTLIRSSDPSSFLAGHDGPPDAYALAHLTNMLGDDLTLARTSSHLLGLAGRATLQEACVLEDASALLLDFQKKPAPERAVHALATWRALPTQARIELVRLNGLSQNVAIKNGRAQQALLSELRSRAGHQRLADLDAETLGEER